MTQAVVTWKDGTLTTNSRPAEGSKAKPTVVQRKVEDQDDKTMLIMVVLHCTLLFKKKVVKGQSNGISNKQIIIHVNQKYYFLYCLISHWILKTFQC